MRLTAAVSAIVLLAGANGVMAEDMTGKAHDTAAQEMSTTANGQIRVRQVLGSDVYTMNPANDEFSWDAGTNFDAVDDNWNDIGEIEDVIVDRQGNFVGIVAEVGGFLDIADKHVLLESKDIQIVPTENGNEYAYVTRKSEEELEALPSVDSGWWE